MFNLLDAGVKLVDLKLELSFELGSLGLQGGGQQAVLDGEQLRVEVHDLHLQGRRNR